MGFGLLRKGRETSVEGGVSSERSTGSSEKRECDEHFPSFNQGSFSMAISSTSKPNTWSSADEKQSNSRF
jgi:hypothetical protein